MNYRTILITGGAGFIGSSLALALKERYPGISVSVIDNLKRRGSELNLPRLRNHSVAFYHGDIRSAEDLRAIKQAELVIDCSAEPSVLAGYDQAPQYIINTNLNGTVNCLERARELRAAFVLLSTSRVYPIAAINSLRFTETETRFELSREQNTPGAGDKGISEAFPLLPGARSLYGATKLASELLLLEYMDTCGMQGVINRCGVIAGPWQMGKVDQGVIALWMAKHLFGQPLHYIGFGGAGRQTRDILHVDDLIELLCMQIANMGAHTGNIYNVGGGLANTVSLKELTTLCETITGKHITIEPVAENRAGDIRFYISDCAAIIQKTGWKPKKTIPDILDDVYRWMGAHRQALEHIL